MTHRRGDLVEVCDQCGERVGVQARPEDGWPIYCGDCEPVARGGCGARVLREFVCGDCGDAFATPRRFPFAGPLCAFCQHVARAVAGVIATHRELCDDARRAVVEGRRERRP